MISPGGAGAARDFVFWGWEGREGEQGLRGGLRGAQARAGLTCGCCLMQLSDQVRCAKNLGATLQIMHSILSSASS